MLLGAGALAGSATIGLASAGQAHAGGPPTAWPRRALAPRDAATVDASQFLPVDQLKAWHEQLDSMGIRATGAHVHEQYVDQLVSRLKQVGVKHVHTEPVPLDRWSATHWSLEVTGPSGAGPIGTSSYIPYSGGTARGGVEGPLAIVPVGQTPAPGSLAGKVAVLRVPATSTPHSTMELIAYGTYDPQHLIDPAGQYATLDRHHRPHLAPRRPAGQRSRGCRGRDRSAPPRALTVPTTPTTASFGPLRACSWTSRPAGTSRGWRPPTHRCASPSTPPPSAWSAAT